MVIGRPVNTIWSDYSEIFGGFFSNPLAVAGFLLLTAFILWGSEKVGKRTASKTEFGFLSALIVVVGK